jgi:tRNA nucleotidyltransferase (CCA-adding enzyme)
MDWATAAAIVSDGMPSLSDAPDEPGDDFEFWQRVKALVDSNGNGELQEAHQHKDTPESFWERMRMVHGPDYGPPKYVEALHPRDRSGKWMEKLGLAHLREVGGAPRDELLGKTPKDIDYVAVEHPERIQQAVKDAGGKAEPLMVRDRLVGVRATHPDLPPGGVEIVPPRVEQSTGAGRHDFTIVPHPGLGGDATPEQMLADDAQRRDFTVNALYRDPKTGVITDPTGRGVEDARSHILHVVHDTSFQEDPLRMLRGARFISQHNLEPDAETLALMRRDSGGMTALTNKGVSGTVQDELRKLLMGDDPGKALRVMRDTGMLQALLPELAPMVGFDQRSPYHEHVLDEHTFEVVDELARMGASYEARLAALFHDSGKPATANLKPGADTFRFHSHPEHGNHQDVGANIARSTLERLNYPRDTINHVTGLVREHMLTAVEKPTPVKARRLRALHSDRFLTDLLDHKQADMEGHGDAIAKSLEGVHKLRGLLAENVEAPRSLKDLNVTGNDLIANGMEPGPRMGAVLRQLLGEVVVNPTLNRREWLLQRAERLAAQHAEEAVELAEANIYQEVLHPRDRLGRWLQKQHGWKDEGQSYQDMVREAVRLRLPKESPEVREHTAKVVLKEIKAPKGKSAATARTSTTRAGRAKRTEAQDAAAELGKVVAGWEPTGKPGEYVPERPSGGARRSARAAGEYVPSGGLRGRWLHKLYNVANNAHAGQTDLQKRPYIEHVLAVADSVSDRAKPVALFHDALEDTKLTPEDLRAALIEPRVTKPEQADEMLDAIKLLTRPPGDDMNYDDYIERIATAKGTAGELAREVKRADLQHNLGRLVPELEHLRPKYEDALNRLTPTPEPVAQRGEAPEKWLDPEVVRERFRALIKGAQDRGVADRQQHWYQTAHDQIEAIAKANNVDPTTFAAMVAATSPQLSWDHTDKDTGEIDYPNLDLALRSLKAARAYSNVPAPALVDHLLAVNDLGGLGTSVEKAVRLARGENPDVVLNAPKTRSFYNNLAWPQLETTATIDAHMGRATLGTVGKKEYGKATTAEGLGDILAEKAGGSGYKWVADQVVAVAHEMGWLPQEAQAVIWVQQKYLSDELARKEAAAKKAKKGGKK